jgi:hypothetical protein
LENKFWVTSKKIKSLLFFLVSFMSTNFNLEMEISFFFENENKIIQIQSLWDWYDLFFYVREFRQKKNFLTIFSILFVCFFPDFIFFLHSLLSVFVRGCGVMYMMFVFTIWCKNAKCLLLWMSWFEHHVYSLSIVCTNWRSN